MGQTLPSNLYDPVLNLDYTMYKWYENTTVLSRLARIGDPTAPIQMNVNQALLERGGQFLHAPVWKPITTLVTRRDMTSTADATPANTTSRDDIAVRVNRKIGPFSITRSAEWMSGQNQAQMAAMFYEESTRRVSLDLRQFIVATAKAAIGNMSGTPNTLNVYNSSSKTNMSVNLLSRTRALLGDKMDEAFAPGGGAAFIFRSEAETDLVLSQQNAGVEGIAARAAAGASPLTLNLDFCLANDSSLLVSGSPYNEYDTLLLGPGFMEMTIVNMNYEPLWMNPKAENVEFVFRGDYDVEFRIPGFAWDTSNGGGNPSLSTIATSAFWLNTYTDQREIWGCVCRHNSSAA